MICFFFFMTPILLTCYWQYGHEISCYFTGKMRRLEGRAELLSISVYENSVSAMLTLQLLPWNDEPEDSDRVDIQRTVSVYFLFAIEHIQN